MHLHQSGCPELGVFQIIRELSLVTCRLAAFPRLGEAGQDFLKLFVHLNDFVLEGGVPSIFAVVVCATEECSCDVCPPILEYPSTKKQDPVFLCRPWHFNYNRI